MSSWIPRGQPGDLDPATQLRIARSFYLVRMVRLGLLLVFALILLGASLATRGTGWEAALFGVVVVAVLTLLARAQLRWRRARSTSETSCEA